MKIPTYLFIIFCLLLVLITFFIHYQNNNKLLMKMGKQLYLTTHRNVESFQNYVPNDLSLTGNWDDLCVIESESCSIKDMTKESLKSVLDEFKQFIDENNIR